LITASSVYIICVILGFTLHIKAGLLVIALVMISHSYNAFFKERGILGSISLPLGIGLLNVFGALAVSGGVPRLVWYAFAATTLYDCGTHITTTFKDIERDERLGITTTPLQLGIKPALICAAVSTLLSFIVAVLPHWLEGVSWHYTLWVVFALLATSITRLPLYLNPTEKNGYRALKGSMVGAIIFFPCLIGVQISLWGSALVILPMLLVTLTLLEVTKREV
jgi:4-hydroxybenzoate polyprenyltransferase